MRVFVSSTLARMVHDGKTGIVSRCDCDLWLWLSQITPIVDLDIVLRNPGEY